MWKHIIMAIAIATACGGAQRVTDPNDPNLHHQLKRCSKSDDHDIMSCPAAVAACGLGEGRWDGFCLHKMAVEVERLREAHQGNEDEREQSTAPNSCGRDATPSELATDEGLLRRGEYMRCLAAPADLLRDAEQQSQQERENERRREKQRASRDAERERAEQQSQQERDNERRREEQRASREQGRKLRETLPCTEFNAERGLMDDAIDRRDTEHPGSTSMIAPPSQDEVRQTQNQCVQTRVAPCQAKVDADDIAGAGSCWEQAHDTVDEADMNRPDVVNHCLNGFSKVAVNIAACTSLKEQTDDEVMAKADCMKRLLLGIRGGGNVHRCGRLDLAGYVERQLTAQNVDAEATRIETKAKEPRARIGARDSACNSFNVIKFYESQLEQEREVGRESGYVDANRMHEIGSTLVFLRERQRTALDEFRRLWKRPLDRARDCKAKP